MHLIQINPHKNSPLSIIAADNIIAADKFTFQYIYNTFMSFVVYPRQTNKQNICRIDAH